MHHLSWSNSLTFRLSFRILLCFVFVINESPIPSISSVWSRYVTPYAFLWEKKANRRKQKQKENSHINLFNVGSMFLDKRWVSLILHHLLTKSQAQNFRFEGSQKGDSLHTHSPPKKTPNKQKQPPKTQTQMKKPHRWLFSHVTSMWTYQGWLK